MAQAFLDIDTQIDFVFPSGALYVPGAEHLIGVWAKLNRYAMERGIALVSTACAHTEDDPEFQTWGPHCVVGTMGQLKPHALLAGQKIFEKQHTDLFQATAAEELVAAWDDVVVYGVVTEVCVQAAAWGLLARGKNVTIVRDAVKELQPDRDAAFWPELRERGGRVVTSDEILRTA